MSGETEANESGWTTDTLHAHLQREIDDLRRLLDERYATQTKALDAAFQSAEKAVGTALLAAKEATGKAEVAADKRFDAVNEFRAQLADQAATFLPRAEADVRIKALEKELDDLKTSKDTLAGGRGALLSAVALILVVIPVVVVLANVMTGG